MTIVPVCRTWTSEIGLQEFCTINGTRARA
jgi:hypothetical protein